MQIVISSGHGSKVQGAVGIINEVEEARRVVEGMAKALEKYGHSVTTFHDDVSESQGENLDRIVDFHNSKVRDLDISVHFNAFEPTDEEMGTECLWVSQENLADHISQTISEAGDLKDRGAKYRDDLAFLNGTSKPAVLIEVCFVDSSADVEAYQANFESICEALGRLDLEVLSA